MSDDEVTSEGDGDEPREPVHEPATRYGALLDEGAVDVVLHTDPAGYPEVAAAIHADGFDQLIDLTAVDYLTYGAPRGLPAAALPSDCPDVRSSGQVAGIVARIDQADRDGPRRNVRAYR